MSIIDYVTPPAAFIRPELRIARHVTHLFDQDKLLVRRSCDSRNIRVFAILDFAAWEADAACIAFIEAFAIERLREGKRILTFAYAVLSGHNQSLAYTV